MKLHKIWRDLFCKLLSAQFSKVFSFETLKGGMVVWLTLNKKYSWKTVAKLSKKYSLEIGEWQRYDNANTSHNSIRIGFINYNETKIYELINRIKKIFTELRTEVL